MLYCAGRRGGPLLGDMPKHRHTVLLVEDHADTRDAFIAAAGAKGLEVVTAANGHAALWHLREGLRPCLILLDIQMPDMDGLVFRRQQLANPAFAGIPVVVVSGGGATVEAKAAELGLTRFLRKPVDPVQVLGLFEMYCSTPTA